MGYVRWTCVLHPLKMCVTYADHLCYVRWTCVLHMLSMQRRNNASLTFICYSCDGVSVQHSVQEWVGCFSNLTGERERVSEWEKERKENGRMRERDILFQCNKRTLKNLFKTILNKKEWTHWFIIIIIIITVCISLMYSSIWWLHFKSNTQPRWQKGIWKPLK